MSSAFLLWRFGNHLKISITNSTFLSTGRAVESPAPHTQWTENTSTTPAPPFGSFPFQLATEAKEILWGKAAWAHLHTCHIISQILISFAMDKKCIFEKSISLKKAISWGWSQRNSPIAAWSFQIEASKLLAPLFPLEKGDISKLKAGNQILTQISSFLSLHDPVHLGALIEGH